MAAVRRRSGRVCVGLSEDERKVRDPSQFYVRWGTLARQRVEAAPLPAFAQVQACRSADLQGCRTTTAAAVLGAVCGCSINL